MQIEHITERLGAKKSKKLSWEKFQSFKCIVDHAGSITEVGSSNPLAVTWPPSNPVIIVNRSRVQFLQIASVLPLRSLPSYSNNTQVNASCSSDSNSPQDLSYKWLFNDNPSKSNWIVQGKWYRRVSWCRNWCGIWCVTLNILGNLAYTSKTDKYDSFLKLTCIVSNSETGDL